MPINFAESSEGPALLDEQTPAVKVIIMGKEIPESIIETQGLM